LLCSCSAFAWSDEPSQKQMRSLDDQVQEVKSDVLSIAAELNTLEEQLLFPSNTQVAVFVSMSKQATFRLDAVHIAIDGDPAADHIYSFKELDALKDGGVQRIYTGNLQTGDHQLEVTVIGKLDGGKDYSETKQFSFSKDVEPSQLGVALAGPSAGAPPIQLTTR
jgi:hypothetical protein